MIQTQTEKRKRGRPAGSRDSKPRKRRTPAEVAAQPKVVRPIRESDIQAQFFRWLDTVMAPGVPGCKLGHFCFAVPNGIWIPGDIQTRIRVIMSMRRQGMKKGIPDIIIALPLHGRPGACIELKRDKSQTAPGKIHDEQKGWLTRLRNVGYFVEMTVGFGETVAAVGRYLRGEAELPFPWEKTQAEDGGDVHSQAG